MDDSGLRDDGGLRCDGDRKKHFLYVRRDDGGRRNHDSLIGEMVCLLSVFLYDL